MSTFKNIMGWIWPVVVGLLIALLINTFLLSQEKFGMTLSAIYCFVSKNAIPKKKEGIMVYYSKKHVDIVKGITAPEEPQYYTVAEAMEKFNLTRDQLYHYAKYHNIPNIGVR